MRRVVTLWIGIGIAAGAGIVAASLAARSIVLRDELGKICGRGHLVALVRSVGIYQTDLHRALAESRYLNGAEYTEAMSIELQLALRDLIANAAAQSRASQEQIRPADVNRELNLMRSEFRDDKTWKQALRNSDLSTASLERMARDNLRARQWISKQIAPDLNVTGDECRRFYDSHLGSFFLPERRDVSHLFLAAPPETAPEIVEKARAAIAALSVRLAGGEDFAALAAQNSEDEATKLHGGNLGYFSADRMPPDFVEAAAKLRPGETSAPIRTRLGFHILKLIDVRPAQQQTFDEAHGDIAVELENQKRAAAMEKLIVDLGAEASYRRPL